MLKIFAVVIALLGYMLCWGAKAQPLVFGSYLPGYPPMMYLQEGQFQGIFPDLHRAFSQAQDRTPEFMQRSRRHAEQALYTGNADMMALSPAWAESPESLVFSKPIIESADFLYSLPEVTWPPKGVVNVCTREFYQYPSIQPLFDDGSLLRLDVSSQEAQFRLLEKGRCSFAMMNRFVTHWFLNHQFAHLSLTEHPEHSSVVNYHFAFPAIAVETRDRFNAFLEQYQQSGRLEQRLNHYLHRHPDHSASTTQN